MREFAEAELVIPDGKYRGFRYRVHRNPFSGLWFSALESAKSQGYRRFLATGPRQSGKTLNAFVVPTLYHLFEIGETVVCGVPSLDMVSDKWNEDLLPAIEASRFKELLPLKGSGSKGGDPTRIKFRNGATLKFMTAGGGDKARVGFTSRVLVVTEVDGFDVVGGTSREADKFTQMEEVTRSYAEMARVYMECTVSIEEGRTYQELKRGTDSRIAVRCPQCTRYVTPEREHLRGWQDAPNAIVAGELARLLCPSCSAAWTEDDRQKANQDSLLVHRGQDVTPDGKVIGPAPKTDTLGFRWTASHNLFVPISTVAQEEWKASKASDIENADKALRQFWWTLPHMPDKVALSVLDAHVIAGRTLDHHARGLVPADATHVTVGVDVGKWRLHWVAIAWRPNATPHVFDYGAKEVASDVQAEELAIRQALRELRDETILAGWAGITSGGEAIWKPTFTFVDAGYKQDIVTAFCNEPECKPGFFAVKGFGETRIGERERRTTGSKVTGVADGYELVVLPDGTQLIEANADQWKTWFHARASTPKDQPGALTLFAPFDHLKYGRHLIAEKKTEEFVPGRGLVTRWERVNRDNHLLDASCLACVAGHAAGARLVGEEPEQPAKHTDDRDDKRFNPLVAHKGRW